MSHVRALLVLTVVATGCTPKVDSKKLEDTIRTAATAKAVEVKSVTCPADIAAKKDTKFECTLEDGNGTKGVVDCTVGDESAPPTWNLRGEIENLEVVGDLLEKGLSAKENTPVDVQCPKRGILVQKGVSFSCKAVVGVAPDTKTIQYSFAAASEKGDWQISKN